MTRTIDPTPPSINYVQVGWVCAYHDPTYTWGTAREVCSRTSDCDLVPAFALRSEVALERLQGDR